MCDRVIDSMAQGPWSAISRVTFVTKKCQPSGPVNFSYLQDFVNQATATKSLSSVNFSSCLSLTSSMVAWPLTDLIMRRRINCEIMFLFML